MKTIILYIGLFYFGMSPLIGQIKAYPTSLDFETQVDSNHLGTFVLENSSSKPISLCLSQVANEFPAEWNTSIFLSAFSIPLVAGEFCGINIPANTKVDVQVLTGSGGKAGAGCLELAFWSPGNKASKQRVKYCLNFTSKQAAPIDFKPNQPNVFLMEGLQALAFIKSKGYEALLYGKDDKVLRKFLIPTDYLNFSVAEYNFPKMRVELRKDREKHVFSIEITGY